MKTMVTRATLLAGFLLAPCVVFSGQFSWELNTLGGYDSNPAGFAGSAAQALGWTKVKLGWETPTDEGNVSLGYAGSVYSFVPESDWTAHQHAATLGYSGTWSGDLLVGTSGQVSGNWNRPAYSAYSYHEFNWTGWARSKIGEWPYEARIELGSRTYPESGEFDFRKIGLEVSTRHQWPTRTNLIVTAGYNARSYPTATIDDLIAGRTQGSSYQYLASAAFAQGLTEKTGLRLSGWAVTGDGESRWREDYWQVLDDPLARTGLGGTAQLSWLAPGALTVRSYVGGHRVRETYVRADGLHSERHDRLGEAGLVIEGLLPWTAAGRIISWSLDLNAVTHGSDDPAYSYDRAAVMLGVKYAW